MRPTSILFLGTYYAPEPAGSGPVVTDMAEWLADHGWDVTVSTLRPSYPQNVVFEGFRRGENDKQSVNGVRIFRRYSPPPRGGGLLQRGRFELVAFGQILGTAWRKEFRRAECVISICPSILIVAAGWLFAGRKRYHIAVIHDIQSGLARSLKFSKGRGIPYLIESLERFILNRCDHLVVLTDEMATALCAIGVQTPMTVLPPHINESTIYPIDRPKNDVPVLVYSGNLGRKQGLGQILDFAKVLQDRDFVARIVIRGEGNQSVELKSKAVELGLRNVEFEGFVSKEELNVSMGAADIHLVPQLPEGAEFAVPSKIFSIMSSGRPFICTALPDSPLGRLSKSSGAFVTTPPGDAERFADCVVDLLGDREVLNSMGRKGRSYIVENLARDTIMGRFEALLRGRG